MPIWEVLETFEETGKPLSAATKVGELVSLYVRKQEVAWGIVVEQPLSFTIENPLANEKTHISECLNNQNTSTDPG